jgi:hypothetical protein
MRITQVGKSVIHTLHRDLSLDNVLYFPKANKNLVPVHRFTHDNRVYLELHPWHFLIKDRATRKILDHVKVEGGLYPLKPSEKQVLAVTKPSQVQRHNCLGHPSLQVVSHVLRKNNLLVSIDPSDQEVCDACLMGKAHQFPYPESSSVSRVPLVENNTMCVS